MHHKEVRQGTKKHVVEYVFTGKCELTYPATAARLYIRVYEQTNQRAHSFTMYLALTPDSFGRFRPVSVTWLRDHQPEILAYIKNDLGIRKYKGV